MCDTCGCSDPNEEIKISKPGEDKHSHPHHDHDHSHTHSHDHSQSDSHSHSHSNDHYHSHEKKINLEIDVLSKNNLIAERNRGYFEAKNITTLNLVSSPGSGKTSLLEKTIIDLKKEVEFYVIEGDQQTLNDANRIDATGAPVIQVNTGNGCHLDAEMINKAMKELNVKEKSILFIENVGNLVCPAMFDLGESKRVVIMSVTEGEDKPIKYPNMFQSSDLCIINKIDLLPYLEYDLDLAKKYALQVNHHLKFIDISVKTGEGMNEWYKWLKTTKKNNL
ncbi:hydrogenase nickel incorporation protein HypB [Bacteroidota bacterium]